ncbi:hypothetical protein BSL78_30249 [Apostichopus japonicus]|uniref:CARD domain-containing protein n=1 Tax=Stichopus japonicus TaxID=307972 RepID=A0A2G8JB29_STIJA|nr:hypothetical protein BSL78_30249 [Apostichopus japonicus]
MDPQRTQIPMLQRDKDKLKYNHSYIVEQLDIEHIILYLSGMVLTQFEVDKLYSIRDRKERTKRLLNILPTKSALAYQHFRRSLQERYPHIIKKLDSTPYVQHPADDTNTNNKKILVRRESLVLNLKPDDVIVDLSREGILNDSDQLKLRGYRTDEDKSRALVDILPHRGPNAFKSFTLAVRTGQPKLADLLETADISTDEMQNSSFL